MATNIWVNIGSDNGSLPEDTKRWIEPRFLYHQWCSVALTRQRAISQELLKILICERSLNKANLRDLKAATGLVILLKFYPIHQFFSPCDLEIWWMTLKNFRAHLLYYIKFCASYQILCWIQTEATVQKRSIGSKLEIFCAMWPWNLMDDLGKQ